MKPAFLLVILAVAAVNARQIRQAEDSTTTEDSAGGNDSSEDPQPPPATDSPQNPPQEGESCDPENCVNTGACQHFLRCDKETQKWTREECGNELFWNPENGTVHGGNCDLIDNLSDEVEERYRSDKNCLACFWEATGECEQQYRYQSRNNRNRNVLTLSCSQGLVFSSDKETCQLCSDVTKSNGDTCC